MQVKQFEPTLTATNAPGHARFKVATLNVVDSDLDVTLPGFFGRQPVALLPCHDWQSVPLGKGHIYENGTQVVADVQFNLAVPAARDWYEAIKFDLANPPSLQQYSYGFTLRPGGHRPGTHKGRPVRFLQPRPDGTPGCTVHEVSPVLLGAGVGTGTLAVKRHSDQAELLAIRDRLEAHMAAEAAEIDAALRAEWDRFQRNLAR